MEHEHPKKPKKRKIIAGLAAAGALAAGLSQVGEHKESCDTEKPKIQETSDSDVKDLQRAFGKAATTAANSSKPNGSLLISGPSDKEVIRSLLDDVLQYARKTLPWNNDYERDMERINNDHSVNTKSALNQYFYDTNTLWNAVSERGDDGVDSLYFYHRNWLVGNVHANHDNGTVNVFVMKMTMMGDDSTIEVSGVEPYLVPNLLKEVDDLTMEYEEYGRRDFDPSREESDNKKRYKETAAKHDALLSAIVSRYSKAGK